MAERPRWEAPWWRVIWHSLRCPASPFRMGCFLGTVAGAERTYCTRCDFTYLRADTRETSNGE